MRNHNNTTIKNNTGNTNEDNNDKNDDNINDEENNDSNEQKTDNSPRHHKGSIGGPELAIHQRSHRGGQVHDALQSPQQQLGILQL